MTRKKAQVVIKATLCLLVIVMNLILEAINYYYYYLVIKVTYGRAHSETEPLVDQAKPSQVFIESQ